MASTDKYQGLYSSLDPQQKQIRLLTLEPGVEPNPIHCTLEAVSLDNKPEYEALSYVWGDQSLPNEIQVNGQKFEVGRNLWMALSYLRSPTARRVCWIDAICINQSDGPERASQVNMMGDIYRRCQKTTAFLDQGTDGARTAEKFSKGRAMLDMLATNKHLDELPGVLKVGDRRVEISDEHHDFWEALGDFVGRKWWRRIWVVQELVLPPTTDFVYNSELLPYDTVRDAVASLQKHSSDCCEEIRRHLRDYAFNPLLTLENYVEPMLSTRGSYTDGATSMPLFDLRRTFSTSEATNPRDLIYGLMGLAQVPGGSGSVPRLRPDYNLSVKEVFVRAVWAGMSENGGMELLFGDRSKNHGKKTKATPENKEAPNSEEMPSWLPTTFWRTAEWKLAAVEKQRHKMAMSFSASRYHPPSSRPRLVNNDTLLLTALSVDKIADVGVPCDPLGALRDVASVLIGWMGKVGIKDSINAWGETAPLPGSQLDNFWRTTLNDSAELETPEGQSYRRLNEDDYVEVRKLWIELAKHLFVDDEALDDLLASGPKTAYHLVPCLLNRRLIITKKGFIGLAPSTTEIGDEVHIVLGCSAPFILRPLLKSPEVLRQSNGEAIPSYIVIGNGYLQGCMSGEPFEGEDSKIDIRTIALH